MPMVNILSGGLHAERNIEFQDFLALPLGLHSYRRRCTRSSQVHTAAREVVLERGRGPHGRRR